MREAQDAGMSTERAVEHGIRATASVVTSAAIVMVAVLAIFATLGVIDFKMMGAGLAVACSWTRRSCAPCCSRPP